MLAVTLSCEGTQSGRATRRHLSYCRYDVQLVDHSLATNAGGIIFRNSPFARRFVANWAALARAYAWPFADNGALLEASASSGVTKRRRTP